MKKYDSIENDPKNAGRLIYIALLSDKVASGKVSKPQDFRVKNSDKLLSRKFMNLRYTRLDWYAVSITGGI